MQPLLPAGQLLAIPSTIAPTAAVISAIVAVAALWIQGRRARKLLAIELLFKFDDRFNTESFKSIRASAARALLNHQEESSDLDEVLDFFEMVGLLARRNTMDLVMVWSTFFHWLDGYWHAARDYIVEATSDDQTVWEDLVFLHGKLLKIEKKRTESCDSDLTWSREDIDAFIESEASLLATTATMRRSRPRRTRKRKSGPPANTANKTGELS